MPTPPSRPVPPPVLELALDLSGWPLVRALTAELLMVIWALATLVAGVVLVVVGLDSTVSLVAGGVLMLGYGLWAGRGWVRRLRAKYRVLTSGFPTLRLTDLGIQVRNVFGHLDGAALAWTDCAAVVVSRAPAGSTAPAPVTRYVHFVPVDEARVSGRPLAADLRPRLLGLTETQSLTVWLEIAGQRPGADDVVAWVRDRRPGLRLVGAPQSASDE